MKKQPTAKDGVVSLVVCLFIIIIVSLLALSFSAIMRREQRQALDRQLSSEAFYAAETGINDALDALQDDPTIGDINTCDTASQNPISSATERQLDTGVSYTCVFIDKSPTELNYSVSNGSVVRIPLSGSGGVIESVKISWQDPTNAGGGTWATFDGAADFLTNANWAAAAPGMLRLQLIPNTYAPTLTRASVSTGTINAFAFPSASTSSSTFTAGTTTDGSVLTGGCNTAHGDGRPLHCEVTIDNLNLQDYVLTLRGIYDTSNVIVRAFRSGSPIELQNAQAIVDSTGVANAVARRIRVFVPISNNTFPGFSLEIGDDICKRLQVSGTTTTADAAYPGFACDPNISTP